MNKYKAIFIILFSFQALASKCQKKYDVNHPCLAGDTLIDKFSKIKIIVDTTHKYLIALDFNNKILWRTNPWKNQSFRSYDSSMNESFRSNHITAFFFGSNKEKNDPYIYLRFYNSPIAAAIERKNGKLHLVGVM